MDLKAIHKIAYDNMISIRSHSWKNIGAKYEHGQRVASIALNLRRVLFPDDASFDDVLTVAAWFHDICNGIDGHGDLGADKTRELLRGFCTDSEIDEICGIITVHDERSLPDLSIPIKIHQDADVIDHIGVDLLRVHFQYGSAHDLTIAGEIGWLNEEYPAWIKKSRDRLHFDLSKRLFDERSSFLSLIIKRMNLEANPDKWFEFALTEISYGN